MASPSNINWTDHERENWRDAFRDIDFWFNEHTNHKMPGAYIAFKLALAGPVYNDGILWNFGVGKMGSFTHVISTIVMERILGRGFDPVVKVDFKPTSTANERQGIMSIHCQLAITIAKELGLLDIECIKLKEKREELKYYTYGCGSIITSYELSRHIREKIVPRLGMMLSSKRYFLLLENLQIEPDSFTTECGLIPPRWTNSLWFISTTSIDAYKKSKLKLPGVISISSNDHVSLLIPIAMQQSAEHILNKMHQGSKHYWHYIALQCFHYTIVFFHKHPQLPDVTSNELIHRWAAQGIIPQPRMTIKEEEEEEDKEDETNAINNKCSYMYRVGRVILEAFHKYSLLPLPFSPTNETYEATNAGAQFLVYLDLILDGITVDELSDNKKKWISFVGGHGLQVSREWLGHEETRGTTALILRGCSHRSLVLTKLDNFLPKLCFLRVLDLSYATLKLLPYSIGFLQNLRLLSLRGCSDMKSLFISSPSDSTKKTCSYSPLSALYQLHILDMNGVPFSHLTQDIANQKSNLIYLDMSYSEITTFPLNFFQDMSNLEERILVKCSNIVNLPPSMAALSSLTNLEVTGTQIRYFPHKTFEEMQKLQSLKLIDNKKLISLTKPISTDHGYKLERHPTLISFLLIGSPRIHRVSLRGCGKLECVELKNLCALEELDLSGTAIKEMHVGIPNLPRLKCLLLVGVSSLRRFPWHKLERLPDMFYLDHCAERNGSHSDQISQVCVSDSMFFRSLKDTVADLVRDGFSFMDRHCADINGNNFGQVSQICVSDSWIFSSFDYAVADLVEAGRFFQSFCVRIAPCITNRKQLQDEEAMVNSRFEVLIQNHSTYLDAYSSCNVQEITGISPTTALLTQTERHVEIFGMQKTPQGLDYLLSVARSISVTSDTSIKSFSRLGYFLRLEECELHCCHSMEEVFSSGSGVENLRNVHVCNLKSLVSFCPRYSYLTFSSLEHLHLEDCPRLEHVVSHGTTLPCLRTLDILFCYNLKIIFISSSPQGSNTYQLPSLQRIHLQELPLLQHLYGNDTTITGPTWKELHVRGCWSLRRLPRLQECQPRTVKVNGESSWWSKLEWCSPLHRDSYDPKLPPEFASFDERAEMSSYLR